MSYKDQTSSATSYANTITAFFDDRMEADRAIERLVEAGIPRSATRIIADETAGSTEARSHESKGFWAMLGEFFLADDDRSTYAEGIRRGGYLVTVSGYPLDLHDRALDILDDEGSVDIDERSRTWESEGWQRSASSEVDQSYTPASNVHASNRDTDLSGQSGEVIPVVREELRVGKRDVNNGRVRVRSYVSETPVQENLFLRDESVEINRRPVDRPVDSTDEAFVDRTIEAEEHREEAVVSKQARVVEEIELTKSAENRQETVSDTVRKTEVEIEDDRANGLTDTGSSTFRRR